MLCYGLFWLCSVVVVAVFYHFLFCILFHCRHRSSFVPSRRFFFSCLCVCVFMGAFGSFIFISLLFLKHWHFVVRIRFFSVYIRYIMNEKFSKVLESLDLCLFASTEDEIKGCSAEVTIDCGIDLKITFCVVVVLSLMEAHSNHLSGCSFACSHHSPLSLRQTWN